MSPPATKAAPRVEEHTPQLPAHTHNSNVPFFFLIVRAPPSSTLFPSPTLFRSVARNCGSLAIEMSDVAGYVAGVNERISANLRLPDSLPAGTTPPMSSEAHTC